MATKITYNERDGKITVERSETPQVVHFTPKIVLDMAQRGINWTIRATPATKA
jgi:hypothetical protein